MTFLVGLVFLMFQFLLTKPRISIEFLLSVRWEKSGYQLSCTAVLERNTINLLTTAPRTARDRNVGAGDAERVRTCPSGRRQSPRCGARSP